jgi:DNA-binding transcriptional regulator YhcF (GntR family)
MVNAVIPVKKDKPASYGWLQIEKKSAAALSKLAVKSPAAMATIMYMVNRMSRTNAMVISQNAIATELGLTREAINRAIKLLSEHNFIEIIKTAGTSVYVVNTRVAWQGKRGERHAHFHADIIALEREQTQPIDKREPLKQVPVLMGDERIIVGNEPNDPPDQQELSLP